MPISKMLVKGMVVWSKDAKMYFNWTINKEIKQECSL